MDDPKKPPFGFEPSQQLEEGLSKPRRMMHITGRSGGKTLLHNALIQSQMARADLAEMERKLLGMGANIVGDEYVITQFKAEASKLLDEFKQRFEMLHAVGVSVGASWAEIADKPKGNRRARRRAQAKAR